MHNTATRQSFEEILLTEAVVTQDDEDHVVARCAWGDVEVAVATSCLVAPRVGDRVLLAYATGHSYVLAVLQSTEKTTRLSVPGDLSIEVPRGDVTISAGAKVQLTSGDDIGLVSNVFSLHAIDANVVFHRMTTIGHALRAQVDTIKVLADSLDTLSDRILQRAKRAYRFIEGLDQVKARHIDYVAEGNAALHGSNTVVTAKDVVKVDAEQVHIG